LKKVKIKICGVKNTITLDCCSENHINYFGLIFYNKSPRNIDIENAYNLINHIKNIKLIPVGVFVNHKINNLLEIIKRLNLNHIQLHGEEDNNYISKLKKNTDIKIIKAIGIKDKNDLLKTKMYSNIDYYLFDYKASKTELPGGNAKSFNWSILKYAKIDKPWFISGGININNISEILKNLNPYGIDISSGVEDQPGIKNTKKINEIMNIVNA